MIYHFIKSFLRSVKKNRFFYSINLTGFLVGFLLLTVISAYVYQEVSFDRFHTSYSTICRINSGGYGVTPLCFKEKLKNKLPEVSNMVQLRSTNLDLDYKNKPFYIDKAYFSDSEVFQMFSFKLLAGDPEGILETPFTVVLDKSTAIKLFGEEYPLDKTIHGKKGDYKVTGIMEDIPYNSHIQCRAFVSLETLKITEGEDAFNCGTWSALTYVRLMKNTDVKEAELKINAILQDSRMAGRPLNLEPLKNVYFDFENNKYDGCRHGNMQTDFLYLAIAILILSIVIFNYVNLLTVLLVNRMKEFSIRKINGAECNQIIRQILFETFGIVLVSSIISLPGANFLLHPLSEILNIPVSSPMNQCSLYIGYFFGIGVIGFITGFIPGIIISKYNDIKILKNEFVIGKRGMQRKLLLLSQLIIVAVLLNSAFVVKKQIDYLLKKDIGFEYENVVTFKMDKTLKERSDLLKDRLLTSSLIEKVSFSNGLPGDGFTKEPMDISDNRELCYKCTIDPEYLPLYSIDLKYGRNFSLDMGTDEKNSCIINEQACKSIGTENPLDKVINGKRIVGVVKDYNYASLHCSIEPLMLICGKGDIVQIKISSGYQDETIDFIKHVCKRISPDFEFNYTFLNQRMEELYKPDIDMKSSIAIYSVVAFLIALLGLWGLMLFTIEKKTKEVGIRKLHGANVVDTFILFAKEQLSIVLVSNLLAVPITFVIMNLWLRNFAYHVDYGFMIFLKTGIITIVFTVLAISFLIIKTNNVNMVETLKYE